MCAANCGRASGVNGVAAVSKPPWVFDEEESQEKIRRCHLRQRRERNGEGKKDAMPIQGARQRTGACRKVGEASFLARRGATAINMLLPAETNWGSR
jgi:hypothetical protein